MFLNIKKTLFFTNLLIIFVGCSSVSNNTPPQVYINPCKTLEMPKWIYNGFVGVSRITASGNKTKQRNIAIQRALSSLLMSKGSANGKTIIDVNKELKTENNNEKLVKSFRENSNFNITFQNIKYEIVISNIWLNPCTKEIYVQIKEK